MATVIEAYNYKIGLDVSSLQGGGIITKRELAQLKRDFYSLQDPVERTAGKLDRLANALNKGAIDNDRYAEAVRRIKSSYPETIAAQQKQNDIEKQAQAIKRSLMTETQLVSAESKRLGDIVRAGKLSWDEAKQAMALYKQGLPSAADAVRKLAQAERDLAEVQRFAQSVTQSLMTDEQRYQEEMKRVAVAMRDANLSQADATSHLQAYTAAMPKAIAERQRLTDLEQKASAIRRKQMTEDQLVAEKAKELASMTSAGKLSRPEAATELRDFKASLPSAIDAADQLAEAKAEVQRITRAGLSDSQRLAIEEARLTNLVKNHGLAQDEATRELEEYRSKLPGVVDAERQLAEAKAEVQRITRAGLSDSQRLAIEEARLTNLVKNHGLAQGEATRELEEYRSKLPGVVAAERQRNQAMSAAAAIVRQNETAMERYQRQLRETNLLYRRGQLDATNYAREVKRLGDEHRKSGPGGRGMAMASAAFRTPQLLMAAAPVVAGGALLRHSMNIEAMETDFKVLAGSIAKGKQLFAELREAGAESLGVTAFGDAGKMLLQSQVELSEIVPTLKSIADIAGGSKDRFSGLTLAISQVVSAGRLTGEELNQLRERGFNPLNIIMEKTGETSQELRKRMADGKISVEEVMSALKTATSEGGTFFGRTAAQAASANGQLTRMKSEFSEIAANIGSQFHQPVGWLAGKTADILGYLKESGRFLGTDVWGIRDQAAIDEEVRDKIRREKELKAAKQHAEAMRGTSTAEADAAYKQYYSGNEDAIKQLEALQDRNLELSLGKEWLEEYKRLNSQVSDDVKEELKLRIAQNKELERAAKIKEQTDGIEKQLKLAREMDYIRSRSPKLDDETASQLAELKILGATGAELNRHLGLRRELVAVEGRRQSEKDAADRFKQLAEDAKQLKESLRSPMEGLADDFGKLSQMYRAGLLSAEEYAASKMRAARELVNIPNELATKAVSMGDGSDIYAAMVDGQNNREKRDLENLEAARLQRQAELLAQRETARFEVTKQVTAQMREQARLSALINQVNPANAPAPPRPGAAPAAEDAEMLDRIASACERAADRLSDWKIVGV
jgi:tape measure domain-containing protein